MRRFLNKAASAFKKRGAHGIGAFLLDRPLYFYEKFQDSHLESKYQLDLQAKVPLADYDLSQSELRDACLYQAISVAFFDRMMRHVPSPRERYTFIDLGSGKGKALILAAKKGFREVIGVEFSPAIHAIAQRNVSRYQHLSKGDTPIDLRCQNALEFDFPKGDLVIFLYNPFTGDLLEQVLANIERHISENADKEIYILYRNPKCHEQFQARACLQPQYKDEHYMVLKNVGEMSGTSGDTPV